MSQINGTAAPGAPPDPRTHIAEAVYTAMADEDDPPFSDLEGEDLADILTITENYLTAHLNFLSANGFRVVPPGATPVPQTEAEAMGMVQAAKAFFDGQKRRGKLMAGGVKPKLILPRGTH